MNPISGSAPTLGLSVALDGNNVPTNQIYGQGVSYDNNGNQTLGFVGLSLTYDAANRMIAVGGSQSAAYTYDSDNRRIYSRNASGSETIYFYGVDGKKLATYTYAIVTNSVQLTQQSENVYFLGKLISAESNFVQTDRLGSVRSGGPGNLGYQAQYPYGVEYAPQTVNDREKYATYTRDSVTGLDYAMNRYYSSQWGRFLSPDPYGRSISLGNPQSWNRYGYTGGDPANGTDPSGLIDGPPGAPGGPGSGFGWGGGDGAGFGFGGYGCPPDLPSAGNWYDAGGDSPPSVGPSLFETGCGQASGGPSAGADLGPGVLAEALSDAEKALHQKDCAGVFNTKPNLSQTYDPADVLDGIVDGIKMGDEYFGSMWAEKLNPTFAAETQYGSGQWVGGTYQYTSANIILQDNGPGSYLDQGAASLALTLIHELGHVFNIVARLGGSAIQNDANPDGTANAAAEAANALALAPCAKALGLN